MVDRVQVFIVDICQVWARQEAQYAINPHQAMLHVLHRPHLMSLQGCLLVSFLCCLGQSLSLTMIMSTLQPIECMLEGPKITVSTQYRIKTGRALKNFQAHRSICGPNIKPDTIRVGLGQDSTKLMHRQPIQWSLE